MPPKSKRQAKDEESSSSSSSSEESESNSDESVEQSAGWGAYIIGNTRISDTRSKIVRSEVLSFPVCMPSFKKLGIVPVQVATGARHTLVLGSDKKVYGWGCNLLGQLGLSPKTVPYTYEWVHVKALATKRICKLACGHSHSLGLTELGMVFSWGSNTHAQLGTTLTKAWRHEPLPVPKLCLVKGIACGGNTSFAFEKEDGDCFVWGDAKVGHAGVGEPAEGSGFLIEKPMKISTFEENEEEVQEICASEKHFVARSGQVVYVSGDGEWGRLGRGDTETELVPVEIALPEPVPGQSLPTISCSQDATYFLSTVKSKKDGKLHSQLLACGRIGPSSCETVLKPTSVAIPHGLVTKVEGGKGWQMLGTEEGALFYWGKSDVCGNMGTLARHCDVRERRTVPQPLTLLEDKFVGEFTCAEHYTIVFVDYDKSENKEHEIKVPVFGRYEGHLADPQHPFEHCRKAFRQSAEDKCLVDIDDVSEASWDGPTREVKGASNLRVGDEITVWMKDVWAWGTVADLLDKKKPGKEGARVVEVKWLREDWAAKGTTELDLHSDDEDIESSDKNKWTYGLYEFWDSDDEEDDDSSGDASDSDSASASASSSSSEGALPPAKKVKKSTAKPAPKRARK